MRNKIIFAMLLAGLGLGKVSGASPAVDVLPIRTQPIFGAPSPTNTSIYVPPAMSVAKVLTQGACSFVGTLLSGLGLMRVDESETLSGLLMMGSGFFVHGMGYAVEVKQYFGGEITVPTIMWTQMAGSIVGSLAFFAILIQADKRWWKKINKKAPPTQIQKRPPSQNNVNLVRLPVANKAQKRN